VIVSKKLLEPEMGDSTSVKYISVPDVERLCFGRSANTVKSKGSCVLLTAYNNIAGYSVIPNPLNGELCNYYKEVVAKREDGFYSKDEFWVTGEEFESLLKSASW